MSKQLLGQFYTTSNPFEESAAFKLWQELLPQGQPILEPFAGAGHLFSYVDSDWVGFDLEPAHPDVVKRDTIKDFPKGFKVCITNPPYLAKTVISRKKLEVKLEHEDLYLDALEQCLLNCEFVAAIIPSTFWNQKLFKERLFAWDKLDRSVFSDTDNPVGVAFFVPEKVLKSRTFINGEEIFLDPEDIPVSTKFPVKFNEEGAEFMVNGIDTVEKSNIYFRLLEGFDLTGMRDKEGKFKSTNRNMFPVSCPYLREGDLDALNAELQSWRERTRDFFLTSFKSCKKDGTYRKRVSFKEIKWLLSKYYG